MPGGPAACAAFSPAGRSPAGAAWSPVSYVSLLQDRSGSWREVMEASLRRAQEATKDIGHPNHPQEPIIGIENWEHLQASAVHAFGNRAQIGLWSDADERCLNEILHQSCLISCEQCPKRDCAYYRWRVLHPSSVGYIGHLNAVVSLKEQVPHLSHRRGDGILRGKHQGVGGHQPTG